MKKLIVIISLILIGFIAKSQTIGIEKQITLSDGTVGNYLTISSVTNELAGDSILVKVDLNLYKSNELFDAKVNPMPFRHEVQFYRKNLYYITSDSLYSIITRLDTAFFKSYKLITKTQ